MSFPILSLLILTPIIGALTLSLSSSTQLKNKTIFLSNVSKSGATYPSSNDDGFSARELENLNLYTDTTTFSTQSHDWVSIGSDSKTLRMGVKNGSYGDYIRVFTAVEQEPTVDFNLTSSSAAESSATANLTVGRGGSNMNGNATDFTASTNLSNRSVGKSEITSLPSAVNFIVVNIPAERDFIKRVPSPFSV